jgi:hypothetical protein
MPIAFVSASSIVADPSSNTTSQSCTKPAGVANGHFLVAIASRDNDATGVTGFSSSGWQQQTFYSPSGGFPSVGILWKFAGSSEPSSYTFNQSGTSSADQFGIHILAFSGVDTSDPFLVDPAKTDSSGSSSSVPAPGVTIPSGLPAQAMMVCAFLGLGSSTTWSASTSGMTECTDDGDSWLQMATYRELRPAGASGAKTVTAGSLQGRRGVSFALRPLVLDQNITPVGISSGVAVGDVTVNVGAVTVGPNGIPSAYAPGNAIVANVIAPTGIPSAEAFGHALMDGSVSASGIPSKLAFGTTAITVGPVDITSAGGIDSSPAFGTAQVFTSINPTGIAPNPHLFGSAQILRGSRTLNPTGIPPKGIFGTATVTREVVALTTQILVKPTPRVQYELVVVARVPQSNGAPSYIQIDPLSWTSLNYSQKLNAPDTLDVDVLISTLTEPIKQRLKKPNELATELWLYRNGKVVFAGPLLGGQNQGESLSLAANGLLHYLSWMIIPQDLVFKNTDQFNIVKGTVDAWQSGPFRHLGIDTTSVGLSGVSLDITYLKSEVNNVFTKITDLAKSANGFDVNVDPASRKLQCYYPLVGVDRSSGPEAIVFDDRNVTDTNVTFSLGPQDLATDAFGAGTGSGQDGALTFYSTYQNDELRQKFGAVGIGGTFRDVSTQALNDQFTKALVDARSETLWIPGPNVKVTPDADLSAYDVGDIVDYRLHNELDIRGAFRLLSRQISVDENGVESVSASFV